ncbi:MAG: superoxide dismutase family protein [Muribaculaceae bacterium]|nr:superoxide dismutase family protein [Roseburia sp.]MCM1432094.1 superoxide dismutase family protein [Muribaculaceae bacterium]MCM1492106.1 superoxide dismutase family protein [Muribaculaceae bacterium]
MLGERPTAHAKIYGSDNCKKLTGLLYLFPAQGGTIVWVELREVTDTDGNLAQGFRGFHIHEGGACTGNEQDPFADAGGHYNPTGQEHPDHAGDLPPVLVCNGYAWMQVYTGRFRPEEVVGRTVIVHEMPDDLHTQPSGDSGVRLGCGLIESM